MYSATATAAARIGIVTSRATTISDLRSGAPPGSGCLSLAYMRANASHRRVSRSSTPQPPDRYPRRSIGRIVTCCAKVVKQNRHTWCGRSADFPLSSRGRNYHQNNPSEAGEYEPARLQSSRSLEQLRARFTWAMRRLRRRPVESSTSQTRSGASSTPP